MTLDFHLLLIILRHSRADPDFQLFCGWLSNNQTVFFANESNDRFIQRQTASSR